jgi:uncharacterized membrane protein YfcA
VAVKLEAFDWPAIRAGAMVALVFAVPFSAVGAWIGRDGERSPAAPWLALAAALGFVLGAGVAAWVQQRDLPLAHALVCAIGTYVAAQAVFILLRLATGREVRWFAAFFNLTVAAGAGLLGGMLGAALQRRGFSPTRRGDG